MRIEIKLFDICTRVKSRSFSNPCSYRNNSLKPYDKRTNKRTKTKTLNPLSLSPATMHRLSRRSASSLLAARHRTTAAAPISRSSPLSDSVSLFLSSFSMSFVIHLPQVSNFMLIAESISTF